MDRHAAHHIVADGTMHTARGIAGGSGEGRESPNFAICQLCARANAGNFPPPIGLADRRFMSETSFRTDLLSLTAQIVAAHVAHHTLSSEELPKLISTVYGALVAGSLPVPVQKSVFHDYIVCLEDGRELKLLKRHLMTSYNLTPDQYRQKWGLPWNYPMVAPSYAAVRSSLAKESGLGRKPAKSPMFRGRKGRAARAE